MTKDCGRQYLYTPFRGIEVCKLAIKASRLDQSHAPKSRGGEVW